ncbi:MAG: hypothetical protein KGK12_15255 [Armatimonadetes bacterium]|nr:hypothetical protein [Armatimonadota bacterium]
MQYLITAIVLIGGFAAFVVWARSATGQTAMRSRFGEPASLKKRQRANRRRTVAPRSKRR